MKHLYYSIVIVTILLLAVSCNSNPKIPVDKIEEFRSTLTSKDSIEMLHLCDEAMEQLIANKIQEVISSLYEYDDSTGQTNVLSEITAKRLERRLKMFPVLDYKRKYFSFMLEGCNDVEYEVVFATAEQVGTDKPATTMFMFNPVKIGGEWKLCVKMPHDNVSQEDDNNATE